MTFVDEGVRLRKKRQVKHQTTAAPPQTSPRVKTEGSPNCVSNSGPKSEEKAGAGSESLSPLRLASPRAEQDQLFACFVSAMFPLGVESLQISLFGTWLWHIPSRLGCNLALDYATMAVAMGYFGRVSGDSLAIQDAEAAYMAALRVLAAMLGSREKQFASEVLCATMLLGHYETLGGTAHWISHAGGAVRLMRLRGARRSYESAFEYSMFLSCRGTVISHALLAGDSCFLAEPAWQAIPDGLIAFPLLPRDAHLYHIIFCHYAKIPDLIHQIRSAAITGSHDSIKAVLRKAKLLLDDLDSWYDSYVAFDGSRRTPVLLCKRKDTKEHDLPFDDAYMYFDTISASNITAYYAYRILVQLELGTLVPGAYAAENARLGEDICKSVEFLSNSGYCGAQVMRFTLPLAQKVLPIKYQPWIATKIALLEQGLTEETLVPAIALLEK